jgi:TonB family protein
VISGGAKYLGNLVRRASVTYRHHLGFNLSAALCGSVLSNRQTTFQPFGGGLSKVAAATLMLVLCCAPALLGQKGPKSERKVLVSVKPEYSDLLKHAQIGGLVRLKATVSPEGKVTNVEVVGGNPILAQSASTAVMRWKYVPAAAQTVEDISISFSPH